MNTVSITQLYSLISDKVGKETADNLTTYIENIVQEEIKSHSTLLATKDDVSRFEVKLADNKAEVIKWMFIFWVGQIAATFGFILLFLKK